MSTAAVLDSPSSIASDDEWIFSEDTSRSMAAAAKSWVKLVDDHSASTEPILLALRLQMNAELSSSDPDLLEGYSGNESDDTADAAILGLMQFESEE